MQLKDIRVKTIRSTQCRNCPFLYGGMRVSPQNVGKICGDLIQGIDYLCHSDHARQTVCLGARRLQKEMEDLIEQISKK
jgi:hypothetical protein